MRKMFILIAVFLIILAPYGAQGFTYKPEVGDGGVRLASPALTTTGNGATAVSSRLADDMRALQGKVGELEKAREAQKEQNVQFEQSIAGLIKVSGKNIADISTLKSKYAELDERTNGIAEDAKEIRLWKAAAESRFEKNEKAGVWLGISAAAVLVVIGTIIIVLWPKKRK